MARGRIFDEAGTPGVEFSNWEGRGWWNTGLDDLTYADDRALNTLGITLLSMVRGWAYIRDISPQMSSQADQNDKPIKQSIFFDLFRLTMINGTISNFSLGGYFVLGGLLGLMLCFYILPVILLRCRGQIPDLPQYGTFRFLWTSLEAFFIIICGVVLSTSVTFGLCYMVLRFNPMIYNSYPVILWMIGFLSSMLTGLMWGYFVQRNFCGYLWQQRPIQSLQRLSIPGFMHYAAISDMESIWFGLFLFWIAASGGFIAFSNIEGIPGALGLSVVAAASSGGALLLLRVLRLLGRLCWGRRSLVHVSDEEEPLLGSIEEDEGVGCADSAHDVGESNWSLFMLFISGSLPLAMWVDVMFSLHYSLPRDYQESGISNTFLALPIGATFSVLTAYQLPLMMEYFKLERFAFNDLHIRALNVRRKTAKTVQGSLIWWLIIVLILGS